MTPEQESMSDLTKRLREMAGGNEAHYCYKAADRIEQLERDIAAAPAPCVGNDPACPCQDGDLCHYKDSPDGKTKAWAAPEPVAWVGETPNQRRLMFIEPTLADFIRVTPLYAHPVAAPAPDMQPGSPTFDGADAWNAAPAPEPVGYVRQPAPDAEAIMKLADEWYAHGQTSHSGIDEKYAALRAAVEQIVRENAVLRMQRDEWEKECERAEAENLQRGNVIGRITAHLLGNKNNVTDEDVVIAAAEVGRELQGAKERIKVLLARGEKECRAAAPSGWKLVPVEPTMGMYDDWNAAIKNGPSNGFFGTWEAAYKAMLSAAPPALAPDDAFSTKESAMETFTQPKVTGYRQLNEAEAALMNEIKAKGIELGELVAKLRAAEGLDQRWVSIGATDLQIGVMALVRAVAQPTTF